MFEGELDKMPHHLKVSILVAANETLLHLETIVILEDRFELIHLVTLSTPKRLSPLRYYTSDRTSISVKFSSYWYERRSTDTEVWQRGFFELGMFA